MTEITRFDLIPICLSPADQAEALADALNRLGFTTNVWKSRLRKSGNDYSENPCVLVRCGARHVRQPEIIYAAPRIGDDQFWFYRVSPEDNLAMEQIAPISQVSATADLLARMISVPL
jgi:hypothetical protein